MKTQTFGIEIEMNGISRATAAQVIASHFGTRVDHIPGRPYDERTIPDGTGRTWKVVSDRSISGPWEQQTEVVSPICTYDDIETVQALARALRAAGAVAHSSCGIHVHIGCGQHTASSLRNLARMVNAKEDLLTLALGISPERRGQWCRPVDPDFLERLERARPRTLPEFARAWYDEVDDLRAARRGREHYDPSRYYLLNLHAVFQKGTVEFRAFNSTLHAGKIKAYIQLCLAISHAALTATSANPTRPVTDNPKYTFRCWLLKLGLIGEEFATAREHLIANLPGDAAFRHGRPAAAAR